MLFYGGTDMNRLPLNVIVGLSLATCSAAPSLAQSAKSSPKDTNTYSRPAISADTAGPGPQTQSQTKTPKPAVTPLVTGPVNIVKVVDAVVNNTNPNLKNTDTFNDGEVSIAINPLNPNEITMTAFSGGWGTNAPLWHSIDNGTTWTK